MSIRGFNLKKNNLFMKIENIFCYIFKPMGETFQKIYLNKK